MDVDILMWFIPLHGMLNSIPGGKKIPYTRSKFKKTCSEGIKIPYYLNNTLFEGKICYQLSDLQAKPLTAVSSLLPTVKLITPNYMYFN